MSMAVLRVEVRGLRGDRHPWVAEIAGISDRYGVVRKFIEPHRDYSTARRTMKRELRDVTWEWLLPSGPIYEVCTYESRKRIECRRYCKVHDGELTDATTSETGEWLRQLASEAVDKWIQQNIPSE